VTPNDQIWRTILSSSQMLISKCSGQSYRPSR
jgi:hypothetical protein